MSRTRTAQQRDAHELARTPVADPYRGALADPYLPSSVVGTSPPAADEPAPVAPGPTPRGTPASATLAGILGIALGLTLGLFGLLLLTIVSLQNDYGAPDRSFYRGTDSGYVVLGLVDFLLAGCCGIGGIVLLTGRLSGRIALTTGGWATILLAAFWLVDGSVRVLVPIVLAIAAATMLFFAYQRAVTDWLGVLPPPQPE